MLRGQRREMYSDVEQDHGLAMVGVLPSVT